MKLAEHLREDMVWVLEGPHERDALLAELSRRAAAASGLDEQKIYAALLDREAKGPTATPEGVALPHAMLEGTTENFVAAALVRGGCDFKSERAAAADLVFMIVGPTDKAWQHIRVLARLARICHQPAALKRLRGAADAADFYRRLLEEDARHV